MHLSKIDLYLRVSYTIDNESEKSNQQSLSLLSQSNKNTADIRVYQSKSNSKQQESESERRQLYEAQQKITTERFPNRLSDREEIDRLRTCVAQCPRRFQYFLKIVLKLPGMLDEQAMRFVTNARTNPQWAQESLMSFIRFSKRKELPDARYPNQRLRTTTKQLNYSV